jgi:hypothetical protein
MDEVAVFYGLVLEPETRCYRHGSHHAAEHFTARIREGFSPQGYGPRALSPESLSVLEVRIDLWASRAKIGTEEYDLDVGNLFLIRLDSTCVAVSEQVPKRIEVPTEPAQLVATLQQLYPGDERVQSLHARK